MPARQLGFPTFHLRISAAPLKVGPWCDHVKNGMEHGLDTSGARKLSRLAGASTIVVPRRHCRKAAESSILWREKNRMRLSH
ncbi:hypothetical protein IAS59_005836 [Cryptococcus gattii]